MISPGFFQQNERADDVGLDEVGGTIDRAIDVALGGKVHDRVGLVRRQYLPHRGLIGDVGLYQKMAAMVPRLLQCLLGGRVGQLVHIDDGVIRLAHQMRVRRLSQ